MRIIIEVDAAEGTVKAEATGPAAQPSTAPSTWGAVSPPAEVLAAAAAIGALDAGPAPTEPPPGAGAPTITIPSSGARQPAAVLTDQSAGASPATAEALAPTVVEEEEEADDA